VLPSPPIYVRCPECGDSLAAPGHVCDDERWVTYRLFQLRDELAAFEEQLATYLDSPHGRFEAWDAARRRP
jgi:hypothetical protein